MEAEKFFQTGLLLRIDVAVIQEDTVIREWPFKSYMSASSSIRKT
jgi:hypothetical protein